MQEKDAALALLSIRGLGPKRYFRLLKAFGSASGVWKHASSDSLRNLVPESVVCMILKGPDAKRLSMLKQYCDDHGIWLLFHDEPDYPKTLKNIHDPPALIFGKGKKEVLKTRSIAIVGSRKASTYGRRVCTMIANRLAKAGLTIVSGLALGIDACAHKAAVECGGSTIAVKGCGIDVDYPARNVALSKNILENGAVISEFFPGTAAEPGNFPSRNRIISGLSQGVLVIEAGERSGSLITAYLALEQGKEVLAVPGSIYSYGSKGCHKLLREGAALVESAEDVVEALGLDADLLQNKESQKVLKRPLISPEASKVIDKLEADPQHIDDIASRCSMPVARVGSVLVELELQDIAISHGSGMYSLKERNE